MVISSYDCKKIANDFNFQRKSRLKFTLTVKRLNNYFFSIKFKMKI